MSGESGEQFKLSEESERRPVADEKNAKRGSKAKVPDEQIVSEEEMQKELEKPAFAEGSSEAREEELSPKEIQLELKVNWTIPDIQSEQDEIERTAREENLSEKEIMEAISEATLQELTEDIWRELQNTESYDHVRTEHMEDAQQYAEKGEGRNWKTLLDSMKHGKPMQSPIIIIKPDGVPYLVSGNTRLMLSRVLGVKVKILLARMKPVRK